VTSLANSILRRASWAAASADHGRHRRAVPATAWHVVPHSPGSACGVGSRLGCGSWGGCRGSGSLFDDASTIIPQARRAITLRSMTRVGPPTADGDRDDAPNSSAACARLAVLAATPSSRDVRRFRSRSCRDPYRVRAIGRAIGRHRIAPAVSCITDNGQSRRRRPVLPPALPTHCYDTIMVWPYLGTPKPPF
jgi:hypothetical protein